MAKRGRWKPRTGAVRRGAGEFYGRGRAQQNLNADDWELVRPGRAEEFGVKYILFEFTLEQAFSMIYLGDTMVQNRRKQAGS